MKKEILFLIVLYLTGDIYAKRPEPPECKGMVLGTYQNSWNERYSVGEVVFVAPHLLRADESSRGEIILLGKAGDGYGEVCLELKKRGKFLFYKRVSFGDITREDPTHGSGGAYKTTR